jgi:hypothetical protein
LVKTVAVWYTGEKKEGRSVPMGIERFPENPLITPEDVRPSREGLEVVGTVRRNE